MKLLKKLFYKSCYHSGRILIFLFIFSLLSYTLSFFLSGKIALFMQFEFCLALGLLLGWFYYKKSNIVVEHNQSGKVGMYYEKYKNGSTMKSLTNAIRTIIFRYGGRNEDHQSFVLNITKGDDVIIQLLHRAHFPELCKSSVDINFGIALYIPLDDSYMNNVMKNNLKKIMREEMQQMKEDKNPRTYFVLDIGARLMQGSYIISRILKEVFNVSDHDFYYELYDDSELPYDKRLLPKFQNFHYN